MTKTKKSETNIRAINFGPAFMCIAREVTFIECLSIGGEPGIRVGLRSHPEPRDMVFNAEVMRNGLYKRAVETWAAYLIQEYDPEFE